MNKVRLTLITKDQYGYQTDYENFARELSQYPGLEISFLCFDQLRPIVEAPEGVTVNYLHLHRFRVLSAIRLFLAVNKAKAATDLFLLKHFHFSGFLNAFVDRKRLIFDIRTMAVNRSWATRTILNMVLHADIAFAHKRIAVSKALIEKYNLRNTSDVGVGAGKPERFEKSRRENVTSLLYIGTFSGRDLGTILEGAQLFVNSNPDTHIEIDFYGRGQDQSFEDALSYLDDSPRIVVRRKEPILNRNLRQLGGLYDFGIVQVPDLQKYEVQPSTKLFEYAALGLPVLASDYPASRTLVDSAWGIIYKPTPTGFSAALGVARNFAADYERLYKFAEEHTWENIVAKDLIPALGLDPKTLASGTTRKADLPRHPVRARCNRLR